jgi:hypothetical protein
MATDPTNPFTEVSVNGMDTMPLDGIVTLPAEMVKLGAGAGTDAAQRLDASAAAPTRHINTLFLIIRETSSASVE